MTRDPPCLSAAPPRALLIWSDGLSLFTELPGPGNLPVILRYPLTTSGLSSALTLVRTRSFDGTGAGTQSPRPYTPPDPPNQPGTPAQRMNALAVLRRMRIVP